MRTIILLMLLGGLALVTDAADPKVTLSKSGRYAARFPDRPRTDVKSIDSAVGKLRVTTDTATVGRDLTLSVSYTDYPESFVSIDTGKLLDTVHEAMTKNAIVQEKSTIENSDGGPQGLELFARMTNTHEMRARLFWQGTRLYQVLAIGKPEKVSGTTATQFLKEFTITK